MKHAIVTIAAVFVLLAACPRAEAASAVTPAVSVNPTVGNGVICLINNLSSTEKTVGVEIVIATGQVACSSSLVIPAGGADALPCNPTNNFYSYCRATFQGSASKFRVNHCVKDTNLTVQACSQPR